MKKLFVITLVSFVSNTSLPQGGSNLYSKEVGVRIENDNLLFNFHDGYYTNGILLSYTKATENRKQKKVTQFEFGQMIFNSETRKISTISEIDRPFAGYLFLRYTQTKFYPSNIFRWNAEVGTIGAISGAKNIQRLYHKLIQIKDHYPGWETELKTEPGINAGFSYMPLLQKIRKRNFKVIPVLQATLGTTFTNAKAGAYFCLGYFEDDKNSALWNAAVTSSRSEKRKRNYEFFSFFYPQLILQGYNATVQGGLFRKDKGTFTPGIKRVMLQNNLAIVYSQRRYKFQIDLFFQSKEATSQHKSSYWASLSGSFRFN